MRISVSNIGGYFKSGFAEGICQLEAFLDFSQIEFYKQN